MIEIPDNDMNPDGHPATLRSAQPGNRNAVKSGIFSRRVREERVEGLRAAAAGTSTLALARAAVRDEVARLRRVLERLDADIAARGPSTRAGAPRGQLSQRSSVSRQLAKLAETWALAEPSDGDDAVGETQDGSAVSLREELFASLALRDLLDHDLEHRGVSTARGGERRQVVERVRASRDLVRLADRIRTEAQRAARTDLAPLSAWDVAREIAFDASQPPRDRILAVKHLLTHPAPRVRSPELTAYEERVRAMSLEEVEAELRELEAAENEARATPRADADAAAEAEEEPEPSEVTGNDATERCLEVLQRIGDGFDPRASARDRIRAAKLREQHLAPMSAQDRYLDEIASMTPEELARELDSLLDPRSLHDEVS